MFQLKNNKELYQSSIVANNRMNRDRNAVGINSYEKDIRLNPIEFIENRIDEQPVSWLDVCCGSGKAIIQTAKYFQEKDLSYSVQLEGIDLVDFFKKIPTNIFNLDLTAIPIEDWRATKNYDLITIVHGLHYVGDKLEIIQKCVSNLNKSGMFIAHLDLKNIHFEGERNSEKIIRDWFKTHKLNYNARSKILKIEGKRNLPATFQYLGADDAAGPNFTGQAAVNSFYKIQKF